MYVFLTHCGIVTSYGDRDRVNIGSGNDLLLNGTKPLPEPMLTLHYWGSVAVIWEQFHSYYSEESVWKLMLDLPGANELTMLFFQIVINERYVKCLHLNGR